MSDDASRSRPTEPWYVHDRPVVVVGGGIAGLVFARDVAKAGRRVIVLEASDRLGGQVSRHAVAGIELDAGAESFATRGGTVAALAGELGLEDRIVAPSPAGAWLYPATGEALPLPATSILGIPGSPLASDVIAVLGGGAAFRAFFSDVLLPGPVGAKSSTLGELVRRRMGDAVVDRLVTPVAQGVHSAHPDELPLDRVAPGVRIAMLREGSLARGVRSLRASAPAGSQVQGIRGGVATLVDALLADLIRLGADIRTGAPASGIEADRVTVAGGDGSEDQLSGDVVIAAPRTGADAQPGTEVTLATLVVADARLDAAPRGTGVLVAPGASGVRAKALTHVTAKWPWVAETAAGRHVLRLSYDGAPDRIPDADGICADASALLGVALPPESIVGTAIVPWRRAAAEPPEASPEAGPIRIGEAVAGSGLAAVVRQARERAGSFLEGHSG